VFVGSGVSVGPQQVGVAVATQISVAVGTGVREGGIRVFRTSVGALEGATVAVGVTVGVAVRVADTTGQTLNQKTQQPSSR